MKRREVAEKKQSAKKKEEKPQKKTEKEMWEMLGAPNNEFKNIKEHKKAKKKRSQKQFLNKL